MLHAAAFLQRRATSAAKTRRAAVAATGYDLRSGCDARTKAAMILVTGGSGFIGQHVVRALKNWASGDAIRVFDTNPSRAARTEGVEIVQGSIEDPRAVTAAVRGADMVIHLAAKVQPSSLDARDLWQVNVKGARNTYLAAVQSGCRLFLHMSSAGVYGPPRRAAPFTEQDQANPVTPYQLSKWAGEQALSNIQPERTILNIFRPAGVYGPGSHLEVPRYRRVSAQRWSFELSGGVVVHPTNIEDVVQAILATIDAPAPHGTVFNIGGERALLVQALDALVAEALSVRRRRLVIPPWMGVPIAGVVKPVSRAMGRRGEVLAGVSRGRVFSAAVNDRRFRRRFPEVPVMKLENGVREHIAWAQRQGLL
jgi:dihydroflavonol-4-reductase